MSHLTANCGNVFLRSNVIDAFLDPTYPTTPLALKRTDVPNPETEPNTVNTFAEVSMFANDNQGVIVVSTMNDGTLTGPLVERMRIHTNGFVGIGKSDPGEALDVAGTVKATAFQGDGSALTNITDPSKVSKAGDTMSGPLNVDGTVSATAFQGDGSALTGIADPSKVSKAGDTMAGPLNLPPNGLIAGTQQLVLADGKVGIGKPNPMQALDVVGTVKATAFQGDGSALTGIADPSKVSKAGDTMAGELIVPSLQVNGFTRSLGLAVNDSTNSGVGRGLWLWKANDTNHVIYSASPTGKSPANNSAVSGFFDANHRFRLRTKTGQGFLFENSSEVALVDIDSDDGRLWTRGALHAGNSDLYFTKTDHNHTGFGNTSGYAAIENAASHDALMILGRAGTAKGRCVKLWDYLQVNGDLDVEGLLSVNSSSGGFALSVSGGGWGHGVCGKSNIGYGVFGESSCYGVYGKSNSSYGYAGYFNGKVRVTGDCFKGGGGFSIDHPLDPEKRYLNHSFVESPERKNLYDGIAVCDAQGEAVVELPAWFEPLNSDLRYQLTPIGAPAPNLHVAAEVQGGRFKIAGGTKGLRVSWLLTGVRRDAWAKANPLVVEEEKATDEQGLFLHPEAHGQPAERGMHHKMEAEARAHAKKAEAEASAHAEKAEAEERAEAERDEAERRGGGPAGGPPK